MDIRRGKMVGGGTPFKRRLIIVLQEIAFLVNLFPCIVDEKLSIL